MQGFYTCIPETNYVPREYNVAAILLLLFMVLISSEALLILTRIQRDVITTVHRCSCEVPLFLSDFNKTRIPSTNFRKMAKYEVS